MNKFRKVTTPQGDVLVDETVEIKEGNFVTDGKNIGLVEFSDSCGYSVMWGVNNNVGVGDYDYHSLMRDWDKIIYTINHSISLDVPMVIVKDANGYLFNNTKPINPSGSKALAFDEGFKECFKASQQKGVYSEEDLINAFNAGCVAMLDSVFITESDNEILYSQSEIDTSLQKFQNLQKQEYVELEMEDCEFCGGDGIYVDGDNNTSKCTFCVKGKDEIKTDRVDDQLMAYLKQ